MNSKSISGSSRVCLGLLVLLALAGTSFSKEQNPAQRSNIFSQTERTSYEKTDVNVIRFQSAEASNIEFTWYPGDTVEFTWTIEAFNSSRLHEGQPANSPLKVIHSKESRALTVRVVSETKALKRLDESVVSGVQGVSLFDPGTGFIWRIRIQVRLPRGIDIDTTQFEGLTRFGQEPTGATPDEEEGKQALKSAQELMRQQNEAELLRRYQELLRSKKNRP